MHIIIELEESRATIVSRDFHSVLILGNWETGQFHWETGQFKVCFAVFSSSLYFRERK